MKTTVPSGATASSLSGVSCVSASACTAVGSYGASSGVVTLAEQWNGTVWTVQSTPNPPSGYWTDASASLNGVSCTQSMTCTAVGSVTNRHCVPYPHHPPLCTTEVLTLAECWNGAAWTIQPTLNPTGAKSNVLSSVSCTTKACTAAGQSNGATLMERSNGTSWTIPTTPPNSGGSALNGVSCTSADACTAVGHDNNLTRRARQQHQLGDPAHSDASRAGQPPALRPVVHPRNELHRRRYLHRCVRRAAAARGNLERHPLDDRADGHAGSGRCPL
jgi:hypothetical protein